MLKIHFVTGNKTKFSDVAQFFKEFAPEIELVMCDLNVPEIQSLDVKAVVDKKAEYAWNIIQQPVLVDDGGLYLERFNQFPGTLSKFVMEGLGPEGFWLLAKEDPRAYFLCYLVYKFSPDQQVSVRGYLRGTIVAPTHIDDVCFPYRSMFIPENEQETFSTISKKENTDRFNHRRLAVKELVGYIINGKQL